MREEQKSDEKKRSKRKDYNSRRGGSGHDVNDSDEEDDRKPPAREVVVQRQRQRQQDEDGEGRGSHNRRRSDSTDESLFSGTTSSIMTPKIRFPESAGLEQLIDSSTASGKLPPPLSSSESYYSHPSEEDVMAPLILSDYEVQERAIRERIYAMTGSLVASALAFLYIFLPFYALVALTLTVIFSALTANEIYRYALTEFDHRRRYTGFGDLLPDRLFQLLTQQSLHEFLLSLRNDDAGPAAGSLYRFLVLYFLPGLTPEQRNSYIQRLPRRHREVLHQPGVGQLLGPTFMSMLMGQEGYHEHRSEASTFVAARAQGRRDESSAQQRTRDPRIYALMEEEMNHNSIISRDQERRAIENARPAPSLRRRLDLDNDSIVSDLGLEIGANDLAGGLTNEQARTMARSMGLPQDSPRNLYASGGADTRYPRRPEEERGWRGGLTMPDLEEHDEDEDDDSAVDENETRIIVEAAIAVMWAQFWRVTRPFTNSATRWLNRVTNRDVLASYASYGGRLALLMGGVGLLGLLAVVDGNPPHLEGETTSTMFSTSFGGMASTLLFRSGLFWRSGGGGQAGGSQRHSFWATVVLGSGGMATTLYTANFVMRWRKEDEKNTTSSSKNGKLESRKNK